MASATSFSTDRGVGFWAGGNSIKVWRCAPILAVTTLNIHDFIHIVISGTLLSVAYVVLRRKQNGCSTVAPGLFAIARDYF
jgi:hypothetical protein